MKLDYKPLNLEFDGDKLYLDGKLCKPDIRTLGQMREVLFDLDVKRLDPNTPTYHMYRDMAPELKQMQMRFDITIIFPLTLGHEFNKTLGHYHPVAVDGLSYTELYNVIDGEAHYLLQKQAPDGTIDDVILVKAKKGDAVPMPPNYGHITINPGKKPLIMSNLVYPNFSSEYHDYEHKRGGAYYELLDGKLIQNPSHGKLPKIRIKKGSCAKEFKPNILAAYKKNPAPFEFLKDPREYKGK